MEPLLWDTSIQRTPPSGCKENQFYSLSFGQAETSIYWPDVISTSSKSFLTRRIDFTVLLLFAFLKKHHFSVGKSEFSSPIAKSTSPGLSDSTFFEPCLHTVDTKFGPGKTSTALSLEGTPLYKGKGYVFWDSKLGFELHSGDTTAVKTWLTTKRVDISQCTLITMMAAFRNVSISLKSMYYSCVN